MTRKQAQQAAIAALDSTPLGSSTRSKGKAKTVVEVPKPKRGMNPKKQQKTTLAPPEPPTAEAPTAPPSYTTIEQGLTLWHEVQDIHYLNSTTAGEPTSTIEKDVVTTYRRSSTPSASRRKSRTPSQIPPSHQSHQHLERDAPSPLPPPTPTPHHQRPEPQVEAEPAKAALQLK